MSEWKEVKSSVHNFEENPTIEGKLVERTPSQYGGNDYIVDVKGEKVKIFGKTVIQTKLEALPLGSEVRITLLGDKKSEKTGRLYQDFLVETK